MKINRLYSIYSWESRRQPGLRNVFSARSPGLLANMPRRRSGKESVIVEGSNSLRFGIDVSSYLIICKISWISQNSWLRCQITEDIQQSNNIQQKQSCGGYGGGSGARLCARVASQLCTSLLASAFNLGEVSGEECVATGASSSPLGTPP